MQYLGMKKSSGAGKLNKMDRKHSDKLDLNHTRVSMVKSAFTVLIRDQTHVVGVSSHVAFLPPHFSKKVSLF